ncbi:hypothetical protein [Streptomyces sp. NBC_01518]|uniref:hypothetical protein n=1 Tax=Streptomyces sp. NBC_01518 TaxID=2903891 RepID=UPI0038650A20
MSMSDVQPANRGYDPERCDHLSGGQVSVTRSQDGGVGHGQEGLSYQEQVALLVAHIVLVKAVLPQPVACGRLACVRFIG